MGPVWELCADTAFLNESNLQSMHSVEGRDGRYLAAEPATGYNKRPHREELKWRLVSEGTGYRHRSSLGHHLAKEGIREVSNQRNKKDDHLTCKTRNKMAGYAKEVATNKENLNGHNKNSRHSNLKRETEDKNIRIINNKLKRSLQKFHHLHRHKTCHQLYNNEDLNRNGRYLQSQRTYRNDTPGYCLGHEHYGASNLRHRRRQSQHADQHKRGVVTWEDIDHKTGHNTSVNKGDYRDFGVTDKSNNWLFNWLFKKEDPRKAEERFYGGLQSKRRSKLDPEKEKQEVEQRFRAATSPHSTFPQAPPRRPGQSVVDESVNTLSLEAEDDEENAAEMNILGVSTNDAVMGRRLLAHRPLPYGSFKTVSLLLDSPKLARKANDLSVFVTAHDMPPLATRLQPYVPFDTSKPTLKSQLKEDVKKGEEEGSTVRLPPVQFRPQVDTEKGPLPRPFHHQGVAWPLAFATQPPYVCPGHEASGVHQPVGVLQTDVVPARPLKARAWELDTEIPAWISPLYKPYGIGGPFGRHGPFVEPKLMEADSRWDEVVRLADAIGALDIPGVVTESGRLDLTGLCGGYVQLKKEEEARIARQQRWTCKSCVAVQNWFKKTKAKFSKKTVVAKEAEGEDNKEEGGKKDETSQKKEEIKKEAEEVEEAPAEEAAAPVEETAAAPAEGEAT